jgi:hypothetical protein
VNAEPINPKPAKAKPAKAKPVKSKPANSKSAKSPQASPTQASPTPANSTSANSTPAKFPGPWLAGALTLVLALIAGVGAAAFVATRGAFSNATTDAPGAEIPAAATPAGTPPAVRKQLRYVSAHWKNYNLDDYGEMSDNDCVNFASQSLIERGWTMDDDWWTSGTGSDFDYTSAWVSSTAFRDYLHRSGRAAALTDDERGKVKLGDIVQFDWDDSGDRDHTGVVTRIERTGDSVKIFYGGHTDDTAYRSVDWAITKNHPGASVYYWSIP